MRFAIAGLGQAGSGMVSALVKNPRVAITAAADLNPETLGRFQADHGAETFGSLEELCKSPNVDAIYIATPTYLHTEHAVAAMEQGKHLVVEKPMALTLEDADAMIGAAERNGVRLVVGHSHSFELPIRRIREIVVSGELGALRMVHTWYYNDWMYRPRLPEEVQTSMGGGVTFRQGSHQFDIIRMIGGGVVRSLRANAGVWDESRPAEGAHTVFLELEGGATATAVYNGYDRFHTSELLHGVLEQGALADEPAYARSRTALRSTGGPEGELTLKRRMAYGSGGRREPGLPPHQPTYGLIIVSCERGDIRQSPDGLLVYGEDDVREEVLTKGQTGRDAVIGELYEAVVSGRAPLHDGRWGKANLEVCLAVLRSSSERREVFLEHQVAVRDGG